MDYLAIKKMFVEKGVIESSAGVYVQKFKRIMNELFDFDEDEEEIFKMDDYMDNLNCYPEFYSKMILEFVNKPKITIYEKENLLKGFIKCIEVLHIDTKIYLKNFGPKMTELKYDKEFQEPTKKEEDNQLSKDDLIKLRDEWKSKLTDKFTKFDLYYVLLSLYTMLPPLRGEDYINSLLVYDRYGINFADKNNHLNLEEKKLYLYNYKTSKSYGVRIIDIPDDLVKILKDFKEKTSTDYVIFSPKKQKLQPSSFNRLFNEATKGKKFGCNMARKSYVSEAIDNKKSIADRKKDAKIMAHSTSTAQTYYSKLSKTLHNDDEDLNSLIEQMKVVNKLRFDLNCKIIDKLQLIV